VALSVDEESDALSPHELPPPPPENPPPPPNSGIESEESPSLSALPSK